MALLAAVNLLLAIEWMASADRPPSSAAVRAIPVRTAGPPSAPLPRSTTIPDEVIKSPRELYFLLERMMGDPRVRLRGHQVKQVRDLLVYGMQATAERNEALYHWQKRLWRVLTPGQKQAIAERPVSVPGGPMGASLIRLLRKRSGLDFMSMDLAVLQARADRLPLADPAAGQGTSNPENLAFGVTTIEADPTLRISRDQAIQILPYVKVQTELFQSHLVEKRRLLKLLDAEQIAYLYRLRASFSPQRGNLPQTSPSELLRMLQEQPP